MFCSFPPTTCSSQGILWQTISKRIDGRDWRRNITLCSNSFLFKNAEGILPSSLEKKQVFQNTVRAEKLLGLHNSCRAETEKLLDFERNCERFLAMFLDKEREIDLRCNQDSFLSASRGTRVQWPQWPHKMRQVILPALWKVIWVYSRHATEPPSNSRQASEIQLASVYLYKNQRANYVIYPIHFLFRL